MTTDLGEPDMQTITYVQCDNPECESTGLPEAVDKKGHPTAPPYGWFVGQKFGCGPNFTCCSAECVSDITITSIVESGRP